MTTLPTVCLSSDDVLPAQSLQHRLAQFNAKERFALVKRLLGIEFLPHSNFMREILDECRITAEPQDVFCAMDFHLDWLYAALIKSNLDQAWKNADCPLPIPVNARGDAPVTGSQQDADFVICFSEEANAPDAATHLFLIEAKGVGHWNTSQLCSKLNQYRAMEDAFRRNAHVKKWLVLMSPIDPRVESVKNAQFRLALKDAESLFEGVLWVKMAMTDTLCVVRCNAVGKPDGKEPTHWKVMPR